MLPGQPCIRSRGTASGFSEKTPMKWIVYVLPSLFLTGTVYCGNLFISSSCFRLECTFSYLFYLHHRVFLGGNQIHPE